MKTRFAPSPTGLMHLGNVRTALFNFLLAKEYGGDFLLRIEDTDRQRSEEQYVTSLCEDLKWLGIVWTQGPEYQSKRLDVYDSYYKELEDKQLAYPCFCQEAALKVVRKAQLAAGQPPRYSGTCRNLSQKEIQAKLDKGLTPALRFKVDQAKVIKFTDLIKGDLSFNAGDIGDFIIRKQDNSASFMFANAVDDSLMQVTHALRGEDHVTNTPRQMLILQALSLDAPAYGHFPIILGEDGAPLSKRNGSVSIQDMREEGYYPAAIINYLSRLGHTYESIEYATIDVLGKNFKLKNTSKSPARHDVLQLKHWQQESMVNSDIADVLASFPEEVSSVVPHDKLNAFAKVILANIIFPQDAVAWAKSLYNEHDLAEHKDIFISTSSEFFNTANSLVTGNIDYKLITSGITEAVGVKGRKLFMPIRIALTGRKDGPELQAIMELLGSDLVKKRFMAAQSYIETIC